MQDGGSSLEAQPVEILDHILEHLPDHSDLLALYLASSIVASVVIPRHLPICCVDIGNLALLEEILRSPLRLQILSLELISQADTTQILLYGKEAVATLPNTDAVENPNVSEILPALLREMKNLRSFHWNVGAISPPAEMFAALRSSASALECVRIHSLRTFGNNGVPDQ